MIPFNGAIPAAGTYIYDLPGAPLHAKWVSIKMNLVFGSAGGTRVDNFLQTSFDGGRTWEDVAMLQGLLVNKQGVAIVNKAIAAAVITAASDGALAADTIRNGVFGFNWRIKQIVVGAYAADSTIRLDVNFE